MHSRLKVLCRNSINLERARASKYLAALTQNQHSTVYLGIHAHIIIVADSPRNLRQNAGRGANFTVSFSSLECVTKDVGSPVKHSKEAFVLVSFVSLKSAHSANNAAMHI
eukprot:4203917-Amphidinium_carterae.2